MEPPTRIATATFLDFLKPVTQVHYDMGPVKWRTNLD